MEANKRQALSDFYREEFIRHLDELQRAGLDAGRGEAHRTCRQLVSRLDDVCCHAEFPVVAETLLQSFDTLTCLSRIDSRTAH